MPRLADIHVDTALSNISVRYNNGIYVADDACPEIQVNKPSNVFFTYSESSMFDWDDDVVNPRDFAPEVEQGYDTDNYSVVYHAKSAFVSDEEQKAADDALSPFQDATELATNKVLLGREIRVANLMTTTSNFASGWYSTPTKLWDDLSSDPIKDIFTAIDTTFGNEPLHAVIGIQAWRKLQAHPNITAAFNFVKEGAVASVEQVASYFGFKTLSVGESRKNTAFKGQTASYSRIWGKHMVIFRRADNPTLRTADFCRTFVFGQRQVVTERSNMRGGGTGGDWVKVTYPYDLKIVAQKAGYLLSGVVT